MSKVCHVCEFVTKGNMCKKDIEYDDRKVKRQVEGYCKDFRYDRSYAIQRNESQYHDNFRF